ncbi:MAG TPA: filamentous hemagglutinin N-terminal domain-containing protein, partial [Trinickia sp.]|uniref:two-partner secretion domain-containing protein n=1 Tax=Trinickia sp. TaxID=2571163 RepID=UPI002BCFA31E
MNSGIYRLVFSPARGMLVAVEENAAAHGRARSSQHARGWRSRIGTRPAGTDIPLQRFAAAVAFAVLWGLAMESECAKAEPTLPMTPDRTGQHPVIGVSASGIPLVNITAPNQAGVSVNNFKQYNVGTKGAVIVNSARQTQSHLAGWVQGNPFIGNAPAQVIINQVTSGNPTRLLGPTEIAGQRANLVIANPAGITCTGCGFVNVPRVSLATGMPKFKADGTLAGFNVTQGGIGIFGSGLEAPGSAIDLIARTMTINAQVWAESVVGIAGTNEVAYGSNASKPQSGSGSSPTVAIDLQALGSMYASSVRLIGTEAGLGVRDAGAITSLTGDIVLSSNGQVTIEASARTQSARDLHIVGSAVMHRGELVSAHAAELQASQELTNTGLVLAGGNVDMSAPSLTNTGDVAAGVSYDGSLAGAGSITLKVERAANKGTLAAGDNININAHDVFLDEGAMFARSAVNVTARDKLSNAGGKIEAHNATLKAGGTFDNASGRLLASGDLNLTNTGLTNAAGIVVGRNIELISENGAIDNTDGTIAAAEELKSRSFEFDNRSGLIRAAGTADITTSEKGQFNNSALDGAPLGGQIDVGKLSLTGGALNNTNGLILTGGDARLDVGSVNNERGSIATGGRLDVRSATDVSNVSGRMGGADVMISGRMIDNTGGAMKSRGLLRVTGNRIRNNLTAGSALPSVHRMAPMDAGMEGGSVKLDAIEHIDNTGGSIRSDNTADLTAPIVDNKRGDIQSLRKIGIKATETLLNEHGNVNSKERLRVATHSLNHAGNLESSGDVLVSTKGDLTNAGRIVAGQSLTVTSGGALTNGGLLSAGSESDISGHAVENVPTGEIIGGDRVTLQAVESIINDGVIDATKTEFKATRSTNTGRVYGDHVMIESNAVTNGRGDEGVSGVIASRGDIDIAAEEVLNESDALIYANNDIRVGEEVSADGHIRGRS